VLAIHPLLDRGLESNEHAARSHYSFEHEVGFRTLEVFRHGPVQ
jgi:hypothetical protein